MAQKLSSLSTEVVEICVELVSKGLPLDSLAIEAEKRHQEITDIGLPETQAALEAVYSLTHFLAPFTEDELRSLVSELARQASENSAASVISLKSDKRRFSNPALLATLLIMSARDKGTRSKAATVCSEALKQKKQPHEFIDWLLSEHRPHGLENGPSIGAGFTNAYKAYRKTQARPGHRVQAVARPLPNTTTISAEDFEDVLRNIFKLSLTAPDLVRAPEELSAGGVFGLWVRPNGNGTSDYAIQVKSSHVIRTELIADQEKRKLSPVDSAANAVNRDKTNVVKRNTGGSMSASDSQLSVSGV